MGAQSFGERNALRLCRQVDEDQYRDPFDADYDPAEVTIMEHARDDLSFRAAVPPEIPVAGISISEARKRLAEARAIIARKKPLPVDDGRRAFASITCWKDIPQLYRRVLARVAGLSADVVEKMDRDLTETEKAMLRSAASDMRGYLESLARL